MNDLWKIWKHVTVREGLVAVAIVMLASFAMHMVIMLGNDRYLQGLLG